MCFYALFGYAHVNDSKQSGQQHGDSLCLVTYGGEYHTVCMG
jgi:hypothetical protein